ncbi:MAG: hypothetical protein HYZ31_01730 [Gammaproteobacteria bacterium]|jgi:hypothetical protein|nr:hypothetical protein [Gammaproteobacteria bacterium]
MRTQLPFLFITCNLIAGVSHAIPLSTVVLPDAIANCSNCVILPQSTTDLDYMNVFDMYRFDTSTGTGTINHLVRYNLSSASALDSTDTMNPEPEITHMDYTGYIWLEAPGSLQSLNTQFNIYTDQISPLSWRNGFNSDNTWTFSMNLDATLAGSGSIAANWSEETWEYIYTGNLSITNGMALCIECAASVTLNLVGFEYTNAGQFIVNPDDPRALLLSYDDYWDYRYTSRDFFVQSIPVPAAIWLFVSGLVTLIGFKRKQLRCHETYHEVCRSD